MPFEMARQEPAKTYNPFSSGHIASVIKGFKGTVAELKKRDGPPPRVRRGPPLNVHPEQTGA
jgi:hypothetical protein